MIECFLMYSGMYSDAATLQLHG